MRPRNWRRMAERHNAAVGAKAPLFASAGLITPLTANDIKECYERWGKVSARSSATSSAFCRALPASGFGACFEIRTG